MSSNTTMSEKSKQVTVTIPKHDEEAKDAIVIARLHLLFKQPWYGNIATRLRLVNADDWCPTAATDGRNFYYNSEFVRKLRPKEVVFLVAHELHHAILDHCGTFSRLNERDSQLWNIAADYVVNSLGVENGLGELITTVPVLYDKKYTGWAVEEVYEDLYKNAKKMDLNSLIDKLLDKHLSDEDDGDGEGEGDGDGQKNGSGPGKITPEQRQAIRDEIREAMLSAAQAVGVGNVPGNMKRFIDGLLESKMDWRQVLQQEIESQIKNDFTYMRPSRRAWSCDAILPSMKREPTVDVTLALDMSGSIGTEEIRVFFSEVKGMVDQFASYNINVMCWDTQVYNYQTFTEDSADDLMNYEPMGGGGTAPGCVFNYLEENGLAPKQLVFFTDLEISDFGPEDQVENVVWLVKNSREVGEAPFGITIKYDD